MLLVELVDTARGAAALENLTPIALLLTQWRHSAEIYADPTLLAILTREPDGDLGPVPMPHNVSDSERGDRAAPPPVDDEYDIRFASTAAAEAGSNWLVTRPGRRFDSDDVVFHRSPPLLMADVCSIGWRRSAGGPAGDGPVRPVECTRDRR